MNLALTQASVTGEFKSPSAAGTFFDNAEDERFKLAQMTVADAEINTEAIS